MSTRKLPLGLKLQMTAIQVYFATISRILPRLATEQSYELFFKTRRYKVPHAERIIAKDAKVESISFQNEKIKLYEWGEDKNPVVLFHHGWNGRASQLSAFLEALLDEGFKVVSFDGPAHGSSSGSKSNLLEFSQLLNELTQRYQSIEAIIAHSFGGMVSSYSLVRYQLPVKKVVLIAAPFSMLEVMRYYREGIKITEKITDRFLAKIEEKFGIHWKDFSGERIVPQQKIPALIIHDEDDFDVLYEQGKLLNQHWKNSELFTTKSLGHRRILKSEKVVEKTVDFIKR